MHTRLSIISCAISLSLLTFTNTYAADPVQSPTPKTPAASVQSVQPIQPVQSFQIQALQHEPTILIDQPPVKINIAASLFIINSHEAVLTKQKNKGMILTLQNVEPYVTKFTGGNNRKASLTSTSDVIHDWTHNKNMISVSKPTAALAGVSIKSIKNTPNYILELSNPVYDAKRATLSFNAKWTGGTAAPQNDMTLTNVSLVVDDGLQVALNTKTSAIEKSLFASAKKLSNK